MAHPFAERARSSSRDKAHALTGKSHHGKVYSDESEDKQYGKGHYARGGMTHEDEAQDRKMIANAMHKHDTQLHPGHHTKLGKSFARGGRTGKVNVNIAINPKGGEQAMPPPPVALPVPPVGGPSPLGASPLPGGAPPPGGPPPMMGRARGGRTKLTGGDNGMGRLEKAQLYKGKRHG